MGVYFIAFASDNRIVTASDAIRVWDLSNGREVQSIESNSPSFAGMQGTDSSMTLSPDGSELTYSYDTAAERTGITTLLDELRSAGIRFKDLRTTQSSLEEIFVSLVRS